MKNRSRKQSGESQEVIRLRRAVEELSVLNELAVAISASMEPDKIMKTIISRSRRAVHAAQANITLVDRNEMIPAGTLVREVRDQESEHYHLNQNLLGRMFHERKALVINDPPGDERLQGVKHDPGIRNLVCVPLVMGAELIGVLSAYNKRDGQPFDEGDKRLLAIIAAQSAQVLERSRLLEEEKAAEFMREEIRLARSIQLGLLPHEAPEIPCYDLAATTLAARQVGGDYFDFISLPDQRWAFALGDVSGKGLPASLLMANLQATLRGQVLQGASCHECLTWCNRLLYLSTPPEKFATLFYCVLDVRSHVLTYCNAGHEHPLLLPASGEVKRLSTGGLAVGVLAEFDYQDDIHHFSTGDLLAIYSDGFTDTVNNLDEPYGEDRLIDSLQRNRDLTADQLIDAAVVSLREFAGKEPPFDDLTLMIIKKLR